MAINVVYQIPGTLWNERLKRERRERDQRNYELATQMNLARENRELAYERGKEQGTAENEAQAERQKNSGAVQLQLERMRQAGDEAKRKDAQEAAYNIEGLKQAGDAAKRRDEQETAYNIEGMKQEGYAAKRAADDERAREEQEARLELQAQKAEDALYQDSWQRRYKAEESFEYSSEAQAEMAKIKAARTQMSQQWQNGQIDDREYRSAQRQLNAQEMNVMPTIPKKPEKTPQQQIDDSTVTVRTADGQEVSGYWETRKDGSHTFTQFSSTNNSVDAMSWKLTVEAMRGKEIYTPEEFMAVFEQVKNRLSGGGEAKGGGQRQGKADGLLDSVSQKLRNAFTQGGENNQKPTTQRDKWLDKKQPFGVSETELRSLETMKGAIEANPDEMARVILETPGIKNILRQYLAENGAGVRDVLKVQPLGTRRSRQNRSQDVGDFMTVLQQSPVAAMEALRGSSIWPQIVAEMEKMGLPKANGTPVPVEKLF